MIKKILAMVLSVIVFPQKCISCGEVCYNICLCKKCQTKFCSNIASKEKRCSVCGCILISEKDICLDCRPVEDNTNTKETENNSTFTSKKDFLQDFDSVFPIHPYVLWKKELLFSWKMMNQRGFSVFFAKVIYSVLENYYKDLPIVPVPPRKDKIKKRGWDQIDELCAYLEKLYNIQSFHLLERITKTEQKKLNREERLQNLSNRYGLKNTTISVPKEVVLIDDIMTTGATLESCAKALKEAGVKHIHAITLFYVP